MGVCGGNMALWIILLPILIVNVNSEQPVYTYQDIQAFSVKSSLRRLGTSTANFSGLLIAPWLGAAAESEYS